MADINKEASWVTARLLEVGNATNDGANVLITDANIQYYNAGGLANTLDISKGGTGATDAAGARTNLGVMASGDVTAAISAAVETEKTRAEGAEGDLQTAVNAKMDKDTDGVAGDIAIIDPNHNAVDSGKSLTELEENIYSAYSSATASGSVVTIEDGADNVPVKTMTVQIEPNQQTSNYDPSPSNILPIKGWTSAPVHRTRKNLWSGSSDELLEYIPSGTYDATNRTFTYAASALAYYPNKKGMIGFVHFPFKDNTRYTLIFTIYKNSGKGANMKCVYTDGTETVLPQVTAAGTKQTIIFTSAANKTIYYIAKYNSAGNTTIYLDESGVFEGVLTTSDFEPYVGNTYSIEFPSEAGTVYGGELTVNEDGTGTLTVDRKGVTLNGSESWTMYTAGKFFVPCTTDASDATSKIQYYISNKYLFAGNGATTSANITTDKRFYGQKSYGRIWVYDSSFTTLEAWEAELATTPLICVYPIDTPIVYQLTTEQVKTLLGLNNIWSDTGNISVDYHADPTLFVEQKTTAIKKTIAYVQNDYTAVQPYEVNDLVYVGDTLYIVTSAIAQGATMTPNTNCSETTLNAVIKSLR